MACEPRISRSANTVVDNETGIIRWVAEVPQDPGDPGIFNYSTKMADTGQYLPLLCYSNNGGAGLTREQAYRAALGEAVERYCCSVYFKEDLTLKSCSEASQDCRALRPGEIALFHPSQLEQIRYTWFTEETKICWTRGYSITRKEPILIPASLVYIPYYPFLKDQGERTIGPGISTGQASGYGYGDALLRGIYEIIERDAFSILWLNRLTAPRIAMDPSPALCRTFREKFKKKSLEYTLYDMTTDIEVPSVLCMIIDRATDPPMICCGGASHSDAEKAALKAMVEAAQTRQWAKFLGKRDKPFAIASDYSNIDDFEKHVFLYAYGNMMRAVRFLKSSKREIALSDLPSSSEVSTAAQLRRILSKIEAKGYEVLVVDLTTVDVAECGYRVLKVLIPQLQQLEGDHNHRFLGGERIYQVPARLGYRAASSLADLNPDPHPYP